MTVPLETNAALNIQVIPQSDTISLELDDRIILRFTPSNQTFAPEVYFAGTGEFLRDFTVVHILDDDGECSAYIAVAVGFYYTMSSYIINCHHISTNWHIRYMPDMLNRYLFAKSQHTCWCISRPVLSIIIIFMVTICDL